MGFWKKAKAALGLTDSNGGDGGERDAAHSDGRPSLDGVEAAPSETLDDVFRARESGDIDGARKLLAELDRGGGIRSLLRAAAALEADDEPEVMRILPVLQAQQPKWKWPLQLSAVVGDPGKVERYRKIAVDEGAPPWAIAWSLATSEVAEEARRGMVDLVFCDRDLARTVAARDFGIEGSEDVQEGLARYIEYAHGRDCIKQFGAGIVAQLYERFAPSPGAK